MVKKVKRKVKKVKDVSGTPAGVLNATCGFVPRSKVTVTVSPGSGARVSATL